MSARTSIASTATAVLVAILLVACAAQAPASTPSPGASALAPSAQPSADPSSEPSTAPSPSTPVDAGSPDPSVAPTPSHTPATPAVWSKPKVVTGLSDCGSVVAAIDRAGDTHLAASCTVRELSQIRYAVSTDPGHWTTTPFVAPAGRLETAPQLAVDGTTLYLAYTRLAPTEGGCGDDGLQDVGVYYRTRSLPGGAWSEPRPIGTTRDELQSFRVSDGVVHATVFNDKTSAVAYVTSASSGSRVELPGAVGATSLRIGDDGTPRVAFEGNGIEYGPISGGTGTFKAIPGSSRGWGPVLVLEPGNVADILWAKSYNGLGCAEPGPEPEDGTYFSTNAGGSWHTVKLSKQLGDRSMTVEPSTGVIHAVIADGESVVSFERSTGGTWSHETLLSGWALSPAIRQNPTTGGLVLALSRGPIDNGVMQVEVMTKG